jgi:heme/copper-type cytochrome/quinol oxidase subunit 1
MRAIDGLARAQRVVVVIALGLALGAVGSYLVHLGGGIRTGWYGYAPLTATFQPPGTGLPTWLRLLIWLVLIAVWALASIRVLRPAPGEETPR